MTPRLLRVVKVGGSLLRQQPDAQAKDIAPILTTWLALQPPALNVLIAGGGQIADFIRGADAAHGLGEEAAHWLCVDALSITARLLGAILKTPVVTQADEIHSTVPSISVFDPAPFLRDIEPGLFSPPLPHTWKVTSDSIAARIAKFLGAAELVLLKSCLPTAATADYVDGYFATAVANLMQVRCVNLRSADFEEAPWVKRP